MEDRSAVGDAAALIVVRAGALDRFAALREAFSSDGVRVVWDRRVGERRWGRDSAPAPERRRRERRGPEPASWALLDFLVVPAAA
jgi:hypothetical protein